MDSSHTVFPKTSWQKEKKKMKELIKYCPIKSKDLNHENINAYVPVEVYPKKCLGVEKIIVVTLGYLKDNFLKINKCIYFCREFHRRSQSIEPACEY